MNKNLVRYDDLSICDEMHSICIEETQADEKSKLMKTSYLARTKSPARWLTKGDLRTAQERRQ